MKSRQIFFKILFDFFKTVRVLLYVEIWEYISFSTKDVDTGDMPGLLRHIPQRARSMRRGARDGGARQTDPRRGAARAARARARRAGYARVAHTGL